MALSSPQIFTSTAGVWDCLFEMLNCECVAGLCPVLRVAGDKV